MVELTVSSPVMTALEVAIYLRLCKPGDSAERNAAGVRAVHRLVRAGKLRPIQPSKEYVFWREEVDAYIRRETAAFKPKKGLDNGEAESTV